MQLSLKILLTIIAVVLLAGFGYFAFVKIWRNEIDLWGPFEAFLKKPSEIIPVKTSPIRVEPASFHVGHGTGAICPFTITNTSAEKLHQIWIMIFSNDVPLSKDYIKFESDKLKEVHSYKVKDDLRFNYSAAIIGAVDSNKTQCYYIILTFLDPHQPITFKIIVDQGIFGQNPSDFDLHLKSLSHSSTPAEIRITGNEITVESKVPEPFTLKTMSFYFQK